MSGSLPSPRPPLDDAADLMRLAAYRDAHPDVIIGTLGFGAVWQARIPEPSGEDVITRYSLAELLDRLDGLDGEPDPPDSG